MSHLMYNIIKGWSWLSRQCQASLAKTGKVNITAGLPLHGISFEVKKFITLKKEDLL